MNNQFSFGWRRHDGINFGSQIVHDKGNRLDMETEFIKEYSHDQKVDHKDGGDWAIRITGKYKRQSTKDPPSPSWISLYFYIGSEVNTRFHIFINSCSNGNLRKKCFEFLELPQGLHGRGE